MRSLHNYKSFDKPYKGWVLIRIGPHGSCYNRLGPFRCAGEIFRAYDNALIHGEK